MKKEYEYDLIVIGGGPGGYVAAIRAAQLGMKVLCIEKRNSLGGTCLNIGCIPSKTLLHSSFLYQQSLKHLSTYGINILGQVGLDLNKMMKNKLDTVQKLTHGIRGLFKKNKVEYENGFAKIYDKGVIEVNGKKIKAKSILIATGSEPSKLDNINIDEKEIVSSTGALEFDKVLMISDGENSKIHNRQPLIINKSKINDYLNLKNNAYEVLQSIKPPELDYYQIGLEINNPKNNYKELINPLPN